MESLLLNGKVFYYDEIAAYSFRNSIPLDGYETKVLEFCRDWLTGVQEFPIQTSGSTGTPKLISLTRQQLEASARSSVKALNIKKNDRALVCLNVETVGGLMQLVRGFLAGMQLTIIEPVSNPIRVLPSGFVFDFASFVPMQIQEMLEISPDSWTFFNQFKAILVGGAPVSGNLLEQIQRIASPIYHTYGMTETASHVALRLLNGPNATSWFKVLPDITIATDARGCLSIHGPVTNFETVITNDVVKIIDADTFEWLGRIDFTINSGGVKVQAEKVELVLESALAQLNLNRNSFIAGLPDEKLGQKVVAVLEGQPLHQVLEAELKQTLKALLSRYEVPKEFLYFPQFQRTASGKLDRLKTLNSALILAQKR